MKVLVACEESQTVCMAFRARGHEAYSCDIKAPSGGFFEWHILGDAVRAMKGGRVVTMDGEEHDIGRWDLMIAHPPCTYLTSAGTRHYSLRMNKAEEVIERMKKREAAIVFFMECVGAPIDRIAIENPLGRMNSVYRHADQIVHPYYFAKDENDAANYEKKRTCLWLKNLPPLTYNAPKPPAPRGYDTKGRAIYWEGFVNGKERATVRSRTFPGIAAAMAEQWGGLDD